MNPPAPQSLPVRRRPHRHALPLLPILLVLGAGAASLVAVVGLVLGAAVLANNRIAPGVRVGAVMVGGQSREAAQAALADAYASAGVTLRDGERTWMVGLSELGVRVDAARSAARALQATANMQIAPELTIDLMQTQDSLIRLSDEINIAAVPGDPPQIGRAVDIPWALDRLRINPAAELDDAIFDLPMIESIPETVTQSPAPSGATTQHIVEAGQELGLIARQYGVSINDIISRNSISDANLIYPGQTLLIPAAGIYVPEVVPPAPAATGRAILVSTGEQRIYAYEDGVMVRTHLVSTGRAETPTVLGDYRIYARLIADDMRGPDYFLPQVPYTMYFFQGYAIHGTYWHNSFGRPMSHGCVNLPVAEAEWFFNFAERGTLVRVI